MEEKRQLRRALLAQSEQQSEAELRASDRAIARCVMQMRAWREARTVFVYVSVRREVDTRGLIAAALGAGKRVVVPLCLEKGRMEAREIRSLEELRPGRYGLVEPGTQAARVAPEEIDLTLAPCVGADRQRYRLGHGGGYYDRFLQQAGGVKACLCRAQALVEALPREAHDVRMDVIITDEGLIR